MKCKHTVAWVFLALAVPGCAGGDWSPLNLDGPDARAGEILSADRDIEIPMTVADGGPDGEAREVQDFTGWEAPTLAMPTIGTLPPGTHLLVAQSCDEVTAQWRRTMLEALRAEMQQYWYLLTHPRYCAPPPDAGYADAWGPVDVVASDPGAHGGADSYSTTNTQEVGVDEADFLKNDGKYLYVLANGRFQVLEAWPPEGLKTVSSTAIEGTPRAMYVQGGVAVIYSSEGVPPGYRECTYGYDCEFTGDGGRMVVTVLDLSDLAHPVMTRQVRASGSYLNSRRVGRNVYTVVYFQDPSQHAPRLQAVPDELWTWVYRCDTVMLPYTEEELRKKFEDLWTQHVATVNAMGLPEWAPQVTDTVYGPGGTATPLPTPFGNCDGVLVSGAGDGRDLISVLSFDLADQAPLNATTVLSRPGAIYATRQSMYLAVRHEASWGMYAQEPFGGGESTSLHKFFLADDAPTTRLVASGRVKGRGLNQFSMDEHDGYLRIATTTGRTGSSLYNTVTVLEEKDGALTRVGELDPLAVGEDIRSVRFGEDTGYVVTFKKTDPLFVIDLHDPTQPAVLGELKIPGFSTYIHFLDPGHLLSIGFDADDQGNFAWFAGIALQIFDVTSLLDPKLLHKLVIGTRGSTSDAATNHLAFNLFQGHLALPLTICDGGGAGMEGTVMSFNGLRVYKVSVETGFEDLGGIEHALPPPSEYTGWNQECSQWWSQSTSSVKRSVFLDDYVFSVALDEIKVSKLSDVSHPVAEASLGP